MCNFDLDNGTEGGSKMVHARECLQEVISAMCERWVLNNCGRTARSIEDGGRGLESEWGESAGLETAVDKAI